MSRALALLFVALGALVGSPALRADTPALVEQKQFADGLFSRGLHEMAATEYRSLLRQAPDFSEADVVLFRLAEAERAQGKAAEASEAYGQLVQRFPESRYRPRAAFRRAELFIAAQRYEEAAAQLEALIEDEPPPEIAASALYYLGYAHDKLGQPDEAAAAFERVVQDHTESPFYSYACLALGQIYLSQPSPRGDGAALLREAMRLRPTPRVGAEAAFLLGDAAFRRGDFEASAEAYATLLREFPDDMRAGEARLQAAWSSLLAGRPADCLRYAQAFRTDVGADPEWSYLEANALRQLGRKDEALAVYGELLRRWPTHTRAAAAGYERVVLLDAAERWGEAWAEGIRLTPPPEQEEDLRWLLVGLAERRGAPRDALAQLDEIRERFPASDRAGAALYRSARLLQAQNEYGRAASLYAEFLEADPGHELAADAWFGLAACQARIGRTEEAVQSWARLIADHTDSPLRESALYQKALADLQLGLPRDAAAGLEKLLADYPETERRADALYWLGHLKEQADELDAAASFLREALEASPQPALRNRTLLALAGLLQRAGEEGEAADALQALLGTPVEDDLDAAWLEWLARRRLAEASYDGAEAAAAALEKRPDPAWREIGATLLGRALEGSGDLTGAAAAYERAVAADAATPEGVEASFRRGHIAIQHEDWETAYRYLERAAARASDEDLVEVRARAIYGLAQVAGAREQWGEAARLFMSVGILFDDPELTPAALREAADAFERAGRPRERERVLRELQERFPDAATDDNTEEHKQP